jgi:hypothetical protein
MGCKHQQTHQLALGDSQPGSAGSLAASTDSSPATSPLQFKPQLRHDAALAEQSSNDQPNGLRKSSEDYEDQAYQALLTGGLKKKKTIKQKGKAVAAHGGPLAAKPKASNKKVAAAVAAKPKAAVAAKPKAAVAAKPAKISAAPNAKRAPGCPRCRFTANGCSQCLCPTYSGKQTKKQWLKMQADKNK